MPEPSRQQKWVRIKQEVTRTPEEGRGGSGSGYLFLLFPTLTWQANVSEFRSSSLFPGGFLRFSSAARSDRWQEIVLAGPQMVLGTIEGRRSSSQSALVAVGIVAARSALAESLGNLRHIGCFVGCAWRVVSAGYSL